MDFQVSICIKHTNRPRREEVTERAQRRREKEREREKKRETERDRARNWLKPLAHRLKIPLSAWDPHWWFGLQHDWSWMGTPLAKSCWIIENKYQKKDTGWGCCAEYPTKSLDIIRYHWISLDYSVESLTISFTISNVWQSSPPRRPPSAHADAAPNLRAQLAHGLKPSWPTSVIKSGSFRHRPLPMETPFLCVSFILIRRSKIRVFDIHILHMLQPTSINLENSNNIHPKTNNADTNSPNWAASKHSLTTE